MIRSLIIAVVIVFSSGACNEGQRPGALSDNSVRDSLTLVSANAYVDTVWNQKDTTYLKDITSGNIQRTLNGIAVADTQREMQAHLNVFFTAFPDLKITLDRTYVREGNAFIQWSTEGTNTGVFGEVNPTGKKVKINGMSQLYFDNEGKLYREIVYYNELDLLQQLGYILVPPVLD